MRILIFISILFVFVSSCKKDTDEIQVDEIPKLELLSVEPLDIQQFEEKLFVYLNYEDGNGDLGQLDPDSTSLTIKDSRLQFEDKYHIPPLAPLEEEIQIKGVLKVEIKNTFLLGTADKETYNYEIKIKDRAGNWSNTVSTPLITVRK